MEKISIIVPVYNAEHTLAYCLESIVRQTYTNLEILLINDGSKDSSLEICKRYQATDSRIIIIDTENHGVSRARNEGIAIAQGTFVGFVDSDDWIDDAMFEKLYEGIKSDDNCCMSIIGVYNDGWTEYLDRLCLGALKTCISAKQAIEEITKKRGLRGYLWNKLFYNTGLLLDEELTVCEDLEYVVRYIIFNPSKSVSVLNTKGYHYKVLENHDFAYLGYGFSKTYAKICSYEKVLSLFDDSNGKALSNIKSASCMVCYDLLVFWYALPKVERVKPFYDEYIPTIKRTFLQYYQEALDMGTSREKIKMGILRYCPILLVGILTIKRNITKRKQ
ncbi:glycosyltransferase family 2 protein [Sphaerochaeta sp. PS]|uniref:glycosyltransferase family 2 protein n=1 Tax=Sphaerochaeta sp. PS TaxID=3076336 RepID=UPI0028A3FAA7|nr:glycosyltransferase family 2 protein [Sphaerochaeta sp. PS]MDT4762158.1 glycosyltransferase family 2 protein [Sphaerochaeta sp. PS]